MSALGASAETKCRRSSRKAVVESRNITRVVKPKKKRSTRKTVGNLDESLLCELCQVSKKMGKSGIMLSGNYLYSYGDPEGISRRATCPLCHLIHSLIPTPTGRITVYAQFGIRPLEISQNGLLIGRIRKEADTLPPLIEVGMQTHDAIVPLDPTLIRSWITECKTHHVSVHSGTASSRYKTPVDITLIDVSQYRLVRTSSECSFVALSYVWGTKKKFHTTSANRSSLDQIGSLKKIWSQIPVVIQDAIEFVRLLGETCYLWVDSLCIEQENIVQKKTQISQMDIIYSQAVLTLIALSATDGDSCLPGVRSGTRLPITSVCMVNGMRFTATPPSFSEVSKTSKYYSRGWTYQEQLLSQRRLYFTHQQVYYVCHECTHSDTMKEYVEPIDQVTLHIPDPTKGHSWITSFTTYARLVLEYTSRELSHQTDSVNAFSGLLTVLMDWLGGSCVSGLPETILDIALLWIPVHPNRHERNPWFPSWSWAGWRGQSQYRCGPIFPWDHKAATSYEFNGKVYLPLDDSFMVFNPVRSEIEQFHSSHQTQPRKIVRDSSMVEEIQDTEGISSKLQHPRDWGMDVLHFWAYSVHEDAFSLSESWDSLDSVSFVLNRKQQHCGLFLLPIPDEPRVQNIRNRDYILLSRSQVPKKGSDWFHTRLFDAQIFNAGPWCLLNVMLIEWRDGHAERIGIYQIHEDAWAQAGPKKKKIVLA